MEANAPRVTWLVLFFIGLLAHVVYKFWRYCGNGGAWGGRSANIAQRSATEARDAKRRSVDGDELAESGGRAARVDASGEEEEEGRSRRRPSALIAAFEAVVDVNPGSVPMSSPSWCG